MNRLVWKELVEQRHVPVAYAGFLTAAIVVWAVMGNYVATHGGQISDRISTAGISGLYWMILPWSGLLVSSSLISSEVESGTLSFLSALPVSRARIWWSKLVAQLASVGLTAAVITVISFLSVLCLFGQAGFKDFVSMNHLHGVGGYPEMPFVLCTFFIVFSLSNLTSTLIDRPLAAAATAFCVGVVGCYVIIVGSGTTQNPSQDNITGLLFLVGYLSFALLLASYITFKKCPTLRTSRRFLVSFVSLAQLLGIPYLLALAGVCVWSYVIRLAELEIPNPTGYFRRNATLNEDLEYGRVEVGRKYQAAFYYDKSQYWESAPVAAKTYSPELSASVLSRTRMDSNHKSFTQYGLEYVFVPSGLSGDETQRINLLSASGKVVGTIDIKAHKTKGFFIPNNALMGNFRDRDDRAVAAM
jgi:ABC-type transport system involved in multi-copper enzyme maturation permease subunit